jgi:ABC-2 type transport system ATP-binding protein
MNILEVEHLKKYYATQKAVDDISFSIKKGTIFGLLGPNGAGKTTLLRMITGIFYPDSGSILFNGKPFNPVNDVKNIGYMPEERGLYKKMKIGDQALYLAQLKGLSRNEAMEKIKYWFTRFGMETWWNKKVEDLSKGMGQKLQFVITVLHEPDLIILDEPFSGLDPVNANLIKDEIYNLAQKGSTIIFSTHRMEQVEEICSQIILINKGFKEHLFSIKFEGKVLPEHLAIHLFNIIRSNENELIIKTNDDFTSNDVLQYFISKGLMISAFQEILPSLNDIFIRLVEGTNADTRQFIQEATV